MVRLGGELAFLVGADGGERKQFVALADQKKAVFAETGIDSIHGVTGGRPRVYGPLNRGRGREAGLIRRLATRNRAQARGQQHELPAIQHNGRPRGSLFFHTAASILEDQTCDNPPMCVLAGSVINWEYKPDAEPGLDLTDCLEVDAHGRVSEEAVVP